MLHLAPYWFLYSSCFWRLSINPLRTRLPCPLACHVLLQAGAIIAFSVDGKMLQAVANSIACPMCFHPDLLQVPGKSIKEHSVEDIRHASPSQHTIR